MFAIRVEHDPDLHGPIPHIPGKVRFVTAGALEAIKMKKSVLLLLMFTLSSVVHGAETTLRCKGKLIRAGMAAEEVLRHCGDPDAKTVEQRPVFSGNRQTGTYEVEIWRYDRGTGQWPADLEVEAGELKSIVYVK